MTHLFSTFTSIFCPFIPLWSFQAWIWIKQPIQILMPSKSDKVTKSWQKWIYTDYFLIHTYILLCLDGYCLRLCFIVFYHDIFIAKCVCSLKKKKVRKSAYSYRKKNLKDLMINIETRKIRDLEFKSPLSLRIS